MPSPPGPALAPFLPFLREIEAAVDRNPRLERSARKNGDGGNRAEIVVTAGGFAAAVTCWRVDDSKPVRIHGAGWTLRAAVDALIASLDDFAR